MSLTEPEQTSIPAPGERRGIPWLGIILSLGLVAALGLAAMQHTNIVNLQLELKQVNKEIGSVRTSLSQTDAQFLETLHVLRNELNLNQQKNEASARSAYAARESLRKQTEAIAERLSQRQDEQRSQVVQQGQQIAEIRNASESTKARLTDVTVEVGSVKTAVASTRSDLEKTISELRRTTGDMGVMSGLIATNAKELAALKELGQRDYYEFTLTKQQKQQRVGDVVMQVKKADQKRNRYTVDVVIDDRRVEKKEKTINEPVQFYVAARARQPYELVVNEVKKDTIIGYLSMPKVKMAVQR